jgi:hypothetical protein
MSNVLDQTKQQQILALGRLGWSLRRIEQALDVRRETISGYLKVAGIAVPGHGRRSIKEKPAISREVSTDSGPPKELHLCCWEMLRVGNSCGIRNASRWPASWG